MKTLDPGHAYELANVEDGVQKLQFIKKERGPQDATDQTLKTLVDGTTNEEVISVLIDRLTFLSNKLPDANTGAAINSLKSALESLNIRTQDRKNRGVEGTDKE